jgi:hypothetical protein
MHEAAHLDLDLNIHKLQYARVSVPANTVRAQSKLLAAARSSIAKPVVTFHGYKPNKQSTRASIKTL